MGRNILDNTLENTPYTGIHEKFPEKEEEKPLIEKPEIAEPLLNHEPIVIQTSETTEEEYVPIPDFLLNIEDNLFAEHGNTSKYYAVKKPHEPDIDEQPFDACEKEFLVETVEQLTSIMSHELLEEAELSTDVIIFNAPSRFIDYFIHELSFNACYNPHMGVNIMSASLFKSLFENMTLSLTNKYLKSSSGLMIASLGIAFVLPINIE